MALTVTHAAVVAVADDGTSPVGSNEWNAAHTVAGRLDGWGNITLAKSAGYTVANADNGSTLVLTGGGNTLTLSAATGYDANFVILAINDDATRAWKISPSGVNTFFLYPRQSCFLFRNGSNWEIAGLAMRWRLSAGVTVYVDPSLGSDSNDGLAAGSGNALATVQKAWDTVCDFIDCAGQTVTIQLADGTYSAGVTTNKAPAGSAGYTTFVIQGNAAAPANVLFNTSIANAGVFEIGQGAMSLGAQVTIKDLEIRNSGTNGNGIAGWGPGVFVWFENIRFGAVNYAHLAARHGAILMGISIAYAVSGSAQFHYFAQTAGQIYTHNSTITFSNSPAFTMFAYASGSGTNLYVGVCTWTNGGTVTGTRYQVLDNALIHAGGGGESYFPGNANGLQNDGGTYVGVPEGSWTPTLIGSTGGFWTLSTAYGSYERVGRTVTCRFYVISSAYATTPTGTILISGLPYTAINVTNETGAGDITNQGGLTNSASYTRFTPIVAAGQAAISLIELGSGVSGQLANVARAGAAVLLQGWVQYRVST